MASFQPFNFLLSSFVRKTKDKRKWTNIKQQKQKGETEWSLLEGLFEKLGDRMIFHEFHDLYSTSEGFSKRQ